MPAQPLPQSTPLVHRVVAVALDVADLAVLQVHAMPQRQAHM